jgi:hypothetical protein
LENSIIPQKYLSLIATDAAKAHLASPALTIAEEGELRIAYAPFDHITPNARLVIVGITPGAAQATAALTASRAAIVAGADVTDALARAKSHASFSGPMRTNLVAMLDAIGVAEYFYLSSSEQLFEAGSDQVHFTSALRYPVFRQGKNYNGTPNMLKTPMLRQMIDTYLAEEARQLPEALWLPLGPKAEEALKHLVQRGVLMEERVLAGMPHPSGANAERVAVFLGRKSPQAASRQTNGAALCAAFKRLEKQISKLKGGAL